MSYLNYPDGVHGTERVFSSIDTTTIAATCPNTDCGFDGDVEADVFLLAAGPTSRTFEYQWTCPTCGEETAEDHEQRDWEDD